MKDLFVRILTASTLLLGNLAEAALPGARDMVFGGGDGIVTTSFDPLGASAEAVIQQKDGKLVVAGYVDKTDPATDEKALLVSRYNPATGALDTTFSGDGVRTVTFRNGIRAAALVQQDDGKLLVTGWSNNGSSDDVAVLRLKTDGSLDNTFGTDGLASTGFGSTNARAFAVLPQVGSAVIVAGYTSRVGVITEDFMLLRYQANGTLDTGFGSSNGLLTDFDSGTDKAYALIRQSDGKLVAVGEASILVKGSTPPLRSKDFAIARYNAAGTLDTSFSADGKHTTEFTGADDAVARAVIQQSDGKLVVVGSSSDGVDRDVAVVRYLSNGSLDTSFSGDGKVLTDLGDSTDIATGVVQQFDGKLLVAGISGNDAVLVRYNTNGTLDTGFGAGDGKLFTSLSNPLRANSMVQQADGQVVVAGRTFSGATGLVALVRYLFDDDDADGVLDTTDNCQFVPNAGQTNTDSDEFGDACDDDDDNDGVKDADDAFPLDPTETIDTDGDGIGNNADPDDDNDGVLDDDDLFPLDPFLLGRVKGDDKGDAAGYSVAMLGDIDGDGFSETLVGAPKNDVILPGKTKATADVGSAYLLSGKTLDIIHTFNGAASGDAFGSAVALVGDVNNDGVPDMAIGAPRADQLDPVAGKVLMRDNGAVTVYSGADFDPLFTVRGEAAGDGFGNALAAAGDVNADNADDIVAGAWKADGVDAITAKKLKDTGAAYLLSGQDGTKLFRFAGTAKGDYFGYSVAGGVDLDHDAVSEVAIGAHKHDPTDPATGKPRKDAGSVYVFSTAAPAYAAVIRLDGLAKSDFAGFALATIQGNGDGFADLLVGAPGADAGTGTGKSAKKDAGSVMLFTDASAAVTSTITATKPQSAARFGSAVAFAGNVDSTGALEFVVGSPKADVTTKAGVKLKDAGEVSVHSVDTGVAVFTMDGSIKSGQRGFAVAGGIDHNQDGYDDITTGSPYALFDNLPKSGIAEVVSGKEASKVAAP